MNQGAGIHFCAACFGPFLKGARKIVVTGGGNSAAEETLHLPGFANQVAMLARGDHLTASRIAVDMIIEPGSRIKIHYNTIVEGFDAENSKLKTVHICARDPDEVSMFHLTEVFRYIRQEPTSHFVKDLVALYEPGYILPGHELYAHLSGNGASLKLDCILLAFETRLPGLFATGDVHHGSTNQVASAVGEGGAAALSIRDYLKTVYHHQENSGWPI